LKFAKMAQDIAPEHPGTLDAIGWVYIQKNEIKKGLPKLKAASEHRPNDPLIQYHLGVAYYKNNDLQAARQALQNAISNPEGFNGRNHAQAILKEISQ
jgi:predicted Zn-dependent protease